LKVSLQRRTTNSAVRKFKPADAPAVEEILGKSPEAAAWSLNSLERLRLRGELAWVIEAQGAVTGFLVARTVADQAEILNLSVDPVKRRKGNATALLLAAFEEFHRLHIKKSFLEVRESNGPAISFYEKHGFVRNGRRPSYYQNPTEAAVLMMRELTG
jgi:[ribosomal protein S18]-alanine N-acetyltransferase